MNAPLVGGVRYTAYSYNITAGIGDPQVQQILGANPRRVMLLVSKNSTAAGVRVLFDASNAADKPVSANPDQIARSIELDNVKGVVLQLNAPAPTNPISIIAPSAVNAVGTIIEGVSE